jgi:hypothetical protein
MRRLSFMLVVFAMLTVASAANALTVRDVIELSKAGVSDEVLLALITVDQRVYTVDADAVKRMKAAGVSDTVMLAMINAGRADQNVQNAGGTLPAAANEPAAPSIAPQPQGFVQDYGPEPAVREVPVPVPVAVAVPVAVPVVPVHQQHISTIITTDTGAAVRARVPVPPDCVKAEPIYWGNGGKRRPGTWEPPAQIVCR